MAGGARESETLAIGNYFSAPTAGRISRDGEADKLDVSDDTGSKTGD